MRKNDGFKKITVDDIQYEATYYFHQKKDGRVNVIVDDLTMGKHSIKIELDRESKDLSLLTSAKQIKKKEYFDFVRNLNACLRM